MSRAEIAKFIIDFLSARYGVPARSLRQTTRLDSLVPDGREQRKLIRDLTKALRSMTPLGPFSASPGTLNTVGELIDAFSKAQQDPDLVARSSRPTADIPAKETRPTPPDRSEYRVWYATDRKPVDSTSIDERYSADPDTKVHFGECRVYVPVSHKIGSTGSSWLRRLVTLTDDRMKIRSLEPLGASTFWDRVSSQISSAPLGERHAVVMVHGFNVSFREAALRAAQIGFDLSIRGAMAFYSWPSQGTIRGYAVDASRIEASEARITQFLTDFAEKAKAEAVHLIAHSMGNRGVLRAINRMAEKASKRSRAKFSQIILAAPDVDYQMFNDHSAAYAKLGRRTSLYVSARDRAVLAARLLQKFPRIGVIPPIWTGPGIDTINVTNVALSGLGHSFVADARAVLEDMHALMRSGRPPEERFGLIPRLTDDGGRYWEIGS